MESRNSLGSLKVGMDGSLIAALEVALPIAGPALGKMATDRALKDWVIIIGVKAIKRRWTNIGQCAKEEPEEGCRKMFAESKELSKGDRCQPRRLKDLGSSWKSAVSKSS